MWIGSGSNDCERVSSMAIIASGGGSVEWGWSLGYLWGTDALGNCGSTTTYYSMPTLFADYRLNGGQEHCRKEGELTYSEVSRTFSLKDHDANTVWELGFARASIDTVDLNFTGGTLVTNGERHAASDSALSGFDQLM